MTIEQTKEQYGDSKRNQYVDFMDNEYAIKIGKLR